MSVSAASLFNRPPPAGAKKATRRVAPVLVTPLPAAPTPGHELPDLAPKSANLTGPSSIFGRTTGTVGQQHMKRQLSSIERKAREVYGITGDFEMEELPDEVWDKVDAERAERMKKLNEAENKLAKMEDEAEVKRKEKKKNAPAKPKKATAAAPSMPEKMIKDGKCYKLVKPFYRLDKNCGQKPVRKAKPKRKLRETAAILGVKRRRAPAKK